MGGGADFVEGDSMSETFTLLGNPEEATTLSGVNSPGRDNECQVAAEWLAAS